MSPQNMNSYLYMPYPDYFFDIIMLLKRKGRNDSGLVSGVLLCREPLLLSTTWSFRSNRDIRASWNNRRAIEMYRTA